MTSSSWRECRWITWHWFNNCQPSQFTAIDIPGIYCRCLSMWVNGFGKKRKTKQNVYSLLSSVVKFLTWLTYRPGCPIPVACPTVHAHTRVLTGKSSSFTFSYDYSKLNNKFQKRIGKQIWQVFPFRLTWGFFFFFLQWSLWRVGGRAVLGGSGQCTRGHGGGFPRGEWPAGWRTCPPKHRREAS